MIRNVYPFAAIAGQEQVKKALIYNLIEPAIGGVLLCGEKGTAKSTIVRGLAAITRQEVVELPLNVTEDMLVGSIDFEKAVRDGVRTFSGGILSRAHHNILYVDEVNLLPDSIVSTLICTAGEGENRVEREGISCVHPAQFVLVGTMNPEEGKLRPQFLDRFGLYVSVKGEEDLDVRADIIRRRMEYERDPAAFCMKWKKETEALGKRIEEAKKLLPEVTVDQNIRRLAVQYAKKAFSEGNRCELVLIRTAAAAAAWEGRDHIVPADLKEAAFYVLPHRRKEENPEQQDSQPKDSQSSGENEDPSPEKDSKEKGENQGEGENDTPQMPQLQEQEGNDGESFDMPEPDYEGSSEDEQTVEGEIISLISALPSLPKDRIFRQGSGRRAKTKSGSNKGRYASYSQTKSAKSCDLAIDATLRAAAPYQKNRDHSQCRVALEDQDLRYKIRENHVGATIVFAVDASGSMGARKRMKVTKETILSMLMDSYQKRDKIGLVAFRQQEAQILLEITNSVELAQRQLQTMPTGGRTPLASGLYQAWQLLKARRLKDPEMLPMLVLVTDGRANYPLWSDDAVGDAVSMAERIRQDGIHGVVIDTEKEFISLHIAKQVADAMGADYYKVDELHKESLQNIVHHGSQKIGSREVSRG